MFRPCPAVVSSGYGEALRTFILKGAMLFPLWSGSPHRARKEMDLLGSGPPDIAHFVDIFREVAAAGVDDGVRFLSDTVAGAAIREDAIYDGIRIALEGRLGVARIPLQVDVGFGDAVPPAPVETPLPDLLLLAMEWRLMRGQDLGAPPAIARFVDVFRERRRLPSSVDWLVGRSIAGRFGGPGGWPPAVRRAVGRLSVDSISR